MAKKVVRGVMIIQKNADARTHPRPPAWTRRLRRAEREQMIHSLLLIRLDITIDGEETRKDGETMVRNGDGERIRFGVERINIS